MTRIAKGLPRERLTWERGMSGPFLRFCDGADFRVGYRIVPAARRICDVLGLMRPPRMRIIVVDWCAGIENRVNNSPLGVGTVLAREQRQISLHGIANQPLVSVDFFGALVQHIELDLLTDHRLARGLGSGTQRDHYVRR